MSNTAGARPGGRSSRVREAIADAVVSLLREPDWSRITLARVAERAQVHPSTVYRRWSDGAELISATLDERLAATSPLPDSGSLAGDIRAHARSLADDLSGPDGVLLVRAAALVGAIGAAPRGPGDGHALAGRTRAVMVMFDRARDRGEPVPDIQEYFEVVAGPMYAYALLIPGQLLARAPALAERFLDLLANRSGRGETPMPSDRVEHRDQIGR